jgi:hypothetical protein
MAYALLIPASDRVGRQIFISVAAKHWSLSEGYSADLYQASHWTNIARMEYEKSASNKLPRSGADNCAVSKTREPGRKNEPKALASFLFDDYGDYVSTEYFCGSWNCGKTAILPGQDPQHGD